MSEQTTPTDAFSPAILASIRFDANGLVPAIAQQHDTGEVLMMAWMDAEAVRETVLTGRVCYFSRSRQALWRKGETSGQWQHLRELRIDCDGDTLLVLVHQDGVACHTGRRNCFYRAVRGGELVEIAVPRISPETLYGDRAAAHAAEHHGAAGVRHDAAGRVDQADSQSLLPQASPETAQGEAAHGATGRTGHGHG